MNKNPYVLIEFDLWTTPAFGFQDHWSRVVNFVVRIDVQRHGLFLNFTGNSHALSHAEYRPTVSAMISRHRSSNQHESRRDI